MFDTPACLLPVLRRPSTPALRQGLCALAVGLCSAGAALANDVSVTMSSFKLVESLADDGTVVIERVATDRVLPGDRVLYRIDLDNDGAEPAHDVRLDLPVHAALVVDPFSFTAGTEFAVTFATREAPESLAPFAELSVPAEDGGTRPAEPADLGAVRVEIAEIGREAETFLEYEANVR